MPYAYDPYNPPTRRRGLNGGGYTADDQAYMAQNGDPNAGLRTSVAGFAARNRQQAQQRQAGLVPRYTGSYGENPSGAGIYANSVRDGGLMTNQQAGAIYAANGYMPNTTVGGGYGLPSPAESANNAYDRYKAGTTIPGGYGQTMARAQHGGATPGMVVDSRGLMRQGWQGGQDVAGPVDQAAVAGANVGLMGKGYTQGANGSWQMSPGMAGYDAMKAAGETFDARRGGLLQRQDDYQNRTAENMAMRQGNAQARGIQRGQGVADTARLRRGQLTMQERMTMQNPAYGLGMAQLQQQGSYQQGLLANDANRIQAGERTAGAGYASREKIAGLQGDQRMQLAQLQTEQAGLQRAHEQAIATGNHAHAAALAQQHAQNQQQLAQLQTGSQEKIAGLNAETTRSRHDQELLARGIDPKTGLPLQQPLRGNDAMNATNQAEQMDWGGMTEEEIANATSGLPAATQQRIAGNAYRQQGQRGARGLMGPLIDSNTMGNPMMNAFMRWKFGM